MAKSRPSVNSVPTVLCLDPDYLPRLRAAVDVDEPLPKADAIMKYKVQKAGRVAVVSVDDVLVSRGGFWYGLPMDQLGKVVTQLANDSSVSSILLDIDSPGGDAMGISEFSDKVVSARQKKPVWAIANPFAASAALWLMSAAERRFVSPGGQVGSHGAIVVHMEQSKLLDEIGITPTIFRSSEFKAEANAIEPLTDGAKERIQAKVDYYGGLFTAALAKNYGIPKSKVISDFGQGKMFIPEDAVAAGMVEKVATLDSLVDTMSRRGPGSRSGARTGLNVQTAKRRLDLLQHDG